MKKDYLEFELLAIPLSYLKRFVCNLSYEIKLHLIDAMYSENMVAL